MNWTDDAHAALKLMESTRENLFITGQAGTGKTTLLEEFRKRTKRNVVILAPTGVAAANIGGRTIHSFCGMGTNSNMKRPKILPEKDPHKKVVEHLDLVIIDEVSMMRADLMDGFDKFLRANRRRPNLPFGGVQIVMVGDLYQLPPVVKREEAIVFAKSYVTPYFFSADVFGDISFRFIELGEVYRQRDGLFLELLQSIRTNTATGEVLAALNSRVVDEFATELEEYVIYLATTNAIADRVNQEHLARIEDEEFVFKGYIAGETEGFQFPTDYELKLKLGAQVMLLNNDKGGRWVNGTVGKFVGVYEAREDDDGGGDDERSGYDPATLGRGAQTLIIETEDGTEHYVARHKWDVVDFQWDEDDQSVEIDVVGTYSQYPVRLAWAVTIHKSQGKTFDKLVVDLGYGAFAHGQLYVALSRCRTLEGIQLVRPVQMKDVLMDERVIQFLDYCRAHAGDLMMYVPGGLF